MYSGLGDRMRKGKSWLGAVRPESGGVCCKSRGGDFVISVNKV